MRSLQSQITWCRRLQLGLGIGLGLAVILFAFAGYRPSKRKLDDLQTQIKTSTRDLEENQNTVRNLPLLAMEVQELESRVRDYDRKFPKQADFGDFIREITQASQQFALADWKYSPGAPRRGD